MRTSLIPAAPPDDDADGALSLQDDDEFWQKVDDAIEDYRTTGEWHERTGLR